METRASTEGDNPIIEWVHANIGGQVVRIVRQARWRPVWWVDVDVDRDGERLELCVRGDRTDMSLIFPLEHEMRLQAVMHDQGIPVAKVHGWIDKPRAFVMDRVGGRNDFEGSTDVERDSVVDDYLQILARLHGHYAHGAGLPFRSRGHITAGPGDGGPCLQIRTALHGIDQPAPGPSIERSTWLSAARCITASG